MTTSRSHQIDRKATRRQGFLRMVAARLAALAIWKGIVLLFGLLVGAGILSAIGAELYNHLKGDDPSPGVTLEKLIALHDFHAAQGQYAFNVSDVIHGGGILFGETIHVAGHGTDDAIVDFSLLTKRAMVIVAGKSVTLLVPEPYLGTPVINLRTTKLTETGSVFVNISHLFKDYPGDAEKALEFAQQQISAAARSSDLIHQAEINTKEFLTSFLGKLGFTKITVVFV
jgi:hypothetical protein